MNWLNSLWTFDMKASKIDQGRYEPRVCEHCGKRFRPSFPNQQLHRTCIRPWRRKYIREYHRKVRRELKRDYHDETQGSAKTLK